MILESYCENHILIINFTIILKEKHIECLIYYIDKNTQSSLLKLHLLKKIIIFGITF